MASTTSTSIQTPFNQLKMRSGTTGDIDWLNSELFKNSNTVSNITVGSTDLVNPSYNTQAYTLTSALNQI